MSPSLFSASMRAAVRPISGLDGSEVAALREEIAAAIDAVYLI
jgi:hypothetical protein